MDGWATCKIVALFGIIVSYAHGQVINTTNCGDGVINNWNTWSTWSGLGSCSVACITDTGENYRARTRACPLTIRSCTVQQHEREYFECQGEASMSVDGGYSQWSDWVASSVGCNVLCGTGKIPEGRTRECNNPRAACGGQSCTRLGRSKETRVVDCHPGSCGRTCSYYSPATVLLVYSHPGYYLLCYRGSVYKIKCPSLSDVAAFFKYGHTNAAKMFKVCQSAGSHKHASLSHSAYRPNHS